MGDPLSRVGTGSGTAARGTIVRLERYAVHDGPGIRTVVFFKGCPLRCGWCHSPETQSPEPELALRAERCLRCGTCVVFCPHGLARVNGDGPVADRQACEHCGACADACPSGARELVGRALTASQIADTLERDTPFFDQSGGGVTLSGGEPLAQPALLLPLLAECRARGMRTAVETCGIAPGSVVDAAADLTDLFLYDLKLIDDGRHRAATGASNRLALENLRRLAARRAAIRVRVPLVPGVNDDDENLDAIGAFVAGLRLTDLDLLPYHRAGLAKYQRLGLSAPMPDLQPPSPEACAAVAGRLARFGLRVHVGGTP